MRGILCAVCGTGFSARSDAMYCSSACRQKAHRARTARRVDALRERLRQPAAARARSEAARSLQRSAARSIERAREQLDRSRELCQVSERRLQESDALLPDPLTGLPLSPAERALWRGN